MKNKIYTLLVFLFISLSGFATDKVYPVSMVSYEQGWSDYNGTLALKNNTQDAVWNVEFLIRYYDMDGKELDYKWFYKDVDIAPGMTKKVEIDAFEYSRDYSYYQSPASPTKPHKFTIKYEMQYYNINESSDSARSTGLRSSHGSNTLLDEIENTFILLLVLGFFIGIYALVISMARKRNRSALGFFLVALFLSPIWAMIILLCIGKKEKNDYPDEW